MFKKWLREPLLHFLLIGGALFLLYGLQNENVVNDNRIVVSETDIDRLITLWEKKWQRLPTQIELQGLIEHQIREEVMYREALAMGLDQNDAIVHRRLAQKVEFISSDLAAQVEPTDIDLADYLAAHAEKFEVPAHINFVQIYFNDDKRGKQAQQEAQQLLEQLTQPSTQIDIVTAGDPFMFGHQHEQLTEHGVSRLFGEDFAAKLFDLKVSGWQGPVSSGYGLHLVRINNKTPAQPAELAAVRNKVRNEWLAQQRRTMDEVFYQSLRQRYEIVIDNAPANENLASTKP